MTIRQKQAQFSLMKARLTIYAYSLGYEISPGEGTITVITCPHCGKWVSKHKRRSLHHDKLAWDVDLFKDGKYLTKTSDHLPLGIYWEKMGGCWGGRFGDGNHYSFQHGKRK